MDAKITKQRLARMLSYDWIKIAVFAVALIFFWTLVLTTTATRITPAQKFYVFNHQNNLTFRSKFSAHLSDCFEKDVFSYEVLEFKEEDLVTAGDAYASTIMEARVSTGEGDVIFISDQGDPNYTKTDEETGEIVPVYTYVESFVGLYYPSLYQFSGENGYFAEMEKFLNGYYGGDYKTGTLNEEKVKSDFRARIKRTKDKRFKKEEQIQHGEKAEVERIKKYKTALEEFNGYLQKGTVKFRKVEVKLGNGETLSGDYAINICPDESKSNLREYVAYTTQKITEQGGTIPVVTAQDMHVCFFEFDKTEKSFEYENLLYLNNLIRVSLKG
jgi:hypothetical protein